MHSFKNTLLQYNHGVDFLTDSSFLYDANGTNNVLLFIVVLQLNFLVQKEILSARNARLRADILAHFIKVAKVLTLTVHVICALL